MDIIYPLYIRGFRQGYHKIHENRFKTIWNFTVFILTTCPIYLETYVGLMIPDDLAGPSSIVSQGDISSADCPCSFPNYGTLFFPTR